MTTRRALHWLICGSLTFVMAGCPKPPTVTHATPEALASTPPAAAVPGVPEGTLAQAVPSRVTKVTVYSDRARVTRQGRVRLSTEPTVFAFSKLPGWVDDNSVRVATSTGRIMGVRVERSFLAKPTDKSWQSAEAEHQALKNQMAALDDEIDVLKSEKKHIESIKAFSREKIAKETILGNPSVKSYQDVLKFLTEALRQNAAALRQVKIQRDELSPKLDASARKLAEMKNLAKLEETTVLVTLQGRTAAPAVVTVTYMMPGVTWEPLHELRVSTSRDRSVEVISFAVVTQTSGEDWGSAALSFSTQSTSQALRIPSLEALTLGDTHTAKRILTSKVTSFNRAQKAFKAQSQLWNKVQQRSLAQRERFDQVYQRHLNYLQVVQSRTVKIFESLRKRGTAAHFKATAVQSIPGDGHPVRLQIGRTTLGSQQQIIAAPEQSLNAARTLTMTNTTGQPFLPGKVALYQDEAFMGMTDMKFVAEGERFSLFLSVADHLKLSRTLDRKQSSIVRKRRTRMQLAFIVTVENLSSAPTTLTLADRIPVSENKEIKVSRVQISPATRPDSRGLLSWKLTLKPRETKRFLISYQVDYPEELILDVRRRRKGRRAPRPDSPAAPRQQNIEDHVFEMEQML